MLLSQSIALFLPIFLCWGSFLGCLGYRLVHGIELTGRSHCPHCLHTIKWYDLFPVISWVWLGGSCRSCKYPISPLYPFIELLTALTFMLLIYLVPTPYIPGYILLFSALIITIRSDLETMLIPRAATLLLIPFGLVFSACGLLPITFIEAIIGMLLGTAILFGIAKLFSFFYKQDCLGQGDIELIALIGAFTGPYGVWATLLIGSTVGSCIGIMYLLWSGNSRNTPLPFGPFLALGAMLYVLFNDAIIDLILPYQLFN